MRIRSTRPEFWRSKRIASVSWEARLVLKGLESYVDDNGVGKDDLALIASDVFPRDLAHEPSGTLRRLQTAIDALHQAGLVHRYTADGTELLYISFWEQVQYIQRPGKGRLPRPDGTSDYGESEIREPAQNPPEPSGACTEPSIPKKGSRGVGEKGRRTSSSEVADATSRPDADELLDYLDQKIREYDPDAKLPTRTKKNRDAARLLIDKDKRTVAQIKAAIDFSQDDEFWRPNIRSMSKLREKYDQLRLKAQNRPSSNVHHLPDSNRRKRYKADFTPEEWDALPVEKRAAIAERGTWS